ncbi:hypothetical protein OAS86_05965, partial [Gammaproteobacteria bacterium]|nr:hypothetical protein [Gammaproteobacteria bacterium]
MNLHQSEPVDIESLLSGGNAVWLETLYQNYLEDSNSVDEVWRELFIQLGTGALQTTSTSNSAVPSISPSSDALS